MSNIPLKTHFDKLGIEYQTKSEINKKQRFSEVFIDLCNFYGIANKVLEAENDKANIIQIFEAFFSMGYSEGLEYGLNNNIHQWRCVKAQSTMIGFLLSMRLFIIWALR